MFCVYNTRTIPLQEYLQNTFAKKKKKNFLLRYFKNNGSF